MTDNHFEYATKADLYEQVGSLRQDIGELKGQMRVLLRVIYYMAGVLSAIGLKILFFTKWTVS